MADTKVSALPAAAAALAAMEFPVNDAGTSRKLTVSLLRDWLFANTDAFAPGSFTLPTGYFRDITDHLTLTGSQVATLQGTSILRLRN